MKVSAHAALVDSNRFRPFVLLASRLIRPGDYGSISVAGNK